MIQYLIKGGANVEHKGYGGINALMHAVINLKEKAVIELLERGADVAATDKKGNTAMHWGCGKGVVTTVTLLIDANTSAEVANDRGTTPLMKSVQSGQISLTQKLVRDVKVDLTKQDAAGDTALHMAIACGWLIVVKELLNGGAPRGLKNNAGETAVDRARHELVIDYLKE